MRKLLLLVMVVFVCLNVFAADRVSLSWVPSTGTNDGTNVYRAAGACPASGLPLAAAKIGQVSGVTAGYDDLSGSGGQVYCYYATSFRTADGSESVGSNTAQATFPYPPLTAPTQFKAVAK